MNRIPQENAAHKKKYLLLMTIYTEWSVNVPLYIATAVTN